MWLLVPAGISTHQPFLSMSLETTVSGIWGGTGIKLPAPHWRYVHPAACHLKQEARDAQDPVLPPSSNTSQDPGGTSASPLALTSPRSLLNQHGHCNRGNATMVQTWGWRRRWWVQLPPDQHPWGQLLSALSLASNLGSSPKDLIHLQVSAYIPYIFIFI